MLISITTNRRLLVNSSGRALIKTGQSCNVSVPLTAVLYGSAGTVVQVVRRGRVETRRVEVGLTSGGDVEIRDGINEGDVVVARAGALLREGDPVRAVSASAAGSEGQKAWCVVTPTPALPTSGEGAIERLTEGQSAGGGGTARPCNFLRHGRACPGQSHVVVAATKQGRGCPAQGLA